MRVSKPFTPRYFATADDLAEIAHKIRADSPLDSATISDEARRVMQQEIFLVLTGWKRVGYLDMFAPVGLQWKRSEKAALKIKRYLSSLGIASLVMDDHEQDVIEAIIACDKIHLDIYTSWPDEETLGRLHGVPESSVRSKTWFKPAIRQSILAAAGIVTVVDFDLTPHYWPSEVALLHARQASMMQAGLLMPCDVPAVFDENDSARSVAQARIVLRTLYVAIDVSPSKSELNYDELADHLKATETTHDESTGTPLSPKERHQLVGRTVQELRTTMTWKDAAAALNARGPDYRPARARKWTAINLYAQFSS